MPSALDVAFSVLGNSQIVPEIAARIARTNLTPADGRVYWRDGRKYQHNLAAVRNVIDSQSPAAWTNSIYNHWLACLRLLSEPTTGSQYPEAMRTRAWAMKTLNTQLASWTHLRYTTALYVKESYTPIVLCLYPKGYVEPRPAFWSRIGEMALATKSVLATLPTNGVFNYTHYTNNALRPTASLHRLRQRRDDVCKPPRADGSLRQHHGHVASPLGKGIEQDPVFRRRQPVLPTSGGIRLHRQTHLHGLVSQPVLSTGKRIRPADTARLTIKDTGDEKGSDYWDALVTTVHTDSPDAMVGDPGSILHEAVGNVQFMLIAVDCGPGDLAVYGAPVLSHYEFELGPTTRLTDAQWKSQVTNNIIPPAPDWTKGYLVPKP